MKKIFTFLFLFLPAAIFAGPSIQGQWELTQSPPHSSPAEYIWFWPDATFEYIAEMSMTETDRGRYQVQGDHITWSGVKFFGRSEARIVRLDAMKLILEMKADFGPPDTYEFDRVRQKSPKSARKVGEKTCQSLCQDEIYTGNFIRAIRLGSEIKMGKAGVIER